MQALIDVILPVFLVIGAGYLVVWKKLFSDDGVDALMRFTQYFAIPCLLFRAISTLDLGENLDPRLLLSFYAGATICFILGMFGARFLFNRPWEDCVAIGFCGLFSNSLLLGLPITERAFGPDALQANYAIIAVHSPFCYGLGITVMEVVRNRGGSPLATGRAVLRAMFRNALVIGIALGFVVNLTGLNIPTPLSDAIDLVARTALPVALFALGGVLFRYRPEGDLRTIFFAVTLSLLVHPMITFAMGTQLDLSTQSLRSAVLTASMAPGVNAYVFANMYGVAKRVAASTVLIATALSIGTIWLWLAVLP
ncbi:AEC family transporter [Falsihalocynthiibacter arcticus]|uniref:Malonate transporter n=1 Tax=Falsihalocynthiibacter arcticus TaxID=1579316 RepID=A0A126V033_9RHOB|nr:AEC family transporter [Falsihalocynthiibacter arcticus]AML51681.1 malonate transporter [Falsihalocynthiibacter arcticus]